MTPEKAMDLASQYGIMNVVLILVLFFLGGLVLYILKQSREREIEQAKENAKRDERWSTLIEKIEHSNNERHIANLASMNVLAEADRKQREEHERQEKMQEACLRGHQKTAELIESLINRLSLNGNR